MQKLILIPASISSLRIIALPTFVYLFNQGNTVACLGLLAFCAATDFFDGFFARRLHATSRFGSYYDATTDFILMLGVFTFFFFLGFYSIWLIVLIIAAFSQFIITSFYAKRLYDPVGRYLGSALYIGVVLTLLSPTRSIFAFVQYAFVGFFLVSIACRTISLTRKRPVNPKLI